MSRALAPYTCDESPTSVYNRHHRAHFWRGLLAQFPGLIDFAAERLADPRLREAFFAHLVALERFLGTTTSDRGHAVCEQDRSSVLYYLLAAPEDARSELVGVLNAFESARGRDTRRRGHVHDSLSVGPRGGHRERARRGCVPRLVRWGTLSRVRLAVRVGGRRVSAQTDS